MIGNERDELGTAIKSARLEKDMTREELAEKLGVTTRHLAAIENKSKKPSLKLLLHLVHELHITADRLFTRKRSVTIWNWRKSFCRSAKATTRE